MDGLEQIMYGVPDFAQVCAENACFVDRTDLIRHYAVILAGGQRRAALVAASKDVVVTRGDEVLVMSVACAAELKRLVGT